MNMKNLDTLLAFNIWRKLRANSNIKVVYLWNEGSQSQIQSVARMLSTLSNPPQIVKAKGVWPKVGPSKSDELHGILSSSYVKAVSDQPKTNAGGVCTVVMPELGTLARAFADEVCAHDFSLGGLNEFNGQNDIYSADILQHLSRVHSSRVFPNWAQGELNELLDRLGGSLHALDIGCGPISRLRWGMINLKIKVTGVDPLNEMYAMLLARHGLDRLESISPDTRIEGFAEDFVWTNSSIDLVYSCNALDHTQDLQKAMQRIHDVLRPGGIALISVYTKEGTRNKFRGLHKFDIWIENESIMYSSEQSTPAHLLDEQKGLILQRVVNSDERSLTVILRRESE